MAQKAYIKLVEGSSFQSITLDDLKSQLLHYREQLAQTGQQLGWGYEGAAFPYTIEQKPDGEGQWFYLRGNNASYRYIVMGIENKPNDDPEPCTVQIVLPDGSTFGDKSKGNELCKYLGKIWKAEVQLFNGRIMYYNPRK